MDPFSMNCHRVLFKGPIRNPPGTEEITFEDGTPYDEHTDALRFAACTADATGGGTTSSPPPPSLPPPSPPIPQDESPPSPPAQPVEWCCITPSYCDSSTSLPGQFVTGGCHGFTSKASWEQSCVVSPPPPPLAPAPPAVPAYTESEADYILTVVISNVALSEWDIAAGCIQSVQKFLAFIGVAPGVGETFSCTPSEGTRRRLDTAVTVTITVPTTASHHQSALASARSLLEGDKDTAAAIFGVAGFSSGTASVTSSGGADKDPHLAFPHGGKADFRGRNGIYYSFLSSPGFAVNVKTEESPRGACRR